MCVTSLPFHVFLGNIKRMQEIAITILQHLEAGGQVKYQAPRLGVILFHS